MAIRVLMGSGQTANLGAVIQLHQSTFALRYNAQTKQLSFASRTAFIIKLFDESL